MRADTTLILLAKNMFFIYLLQHKHISTACQSENGPSETPGDEEGVFTQK